MPRILIIDDEPDLRDVLAHLLEEAGYKVEVASEGGEGISKHRESPADLVITDLHMPGKDGLETLRELREDSEDVKLVAISGSDTYLVETNLDSSRIHGADRTFMKPFNVKQFLAAIRDLLAQR